MRKTTHFDLFDPKGWPNPDELERYFLAPPGERWTFETGNDNWGLTLEGVDGTEHLLQNKGRIDIHLIMDGNPVHGVLLTYQKWGGGLKLTYYSKGDPRRLRELVFSQQGSPRPVGLFIPYEKAWSAVKEFMETDGALPTSIEWVASRDLPPDTFPDPIELRRRRDAAQRT
jgi:hypothetical protein